MSEGLAEASPSVEAEPKPNLERGLGTLDATMIGIGSMIGSGIFIVSADVSKTLGAPGWLLLAWGLAGLLTILGSPCAGEVAAMYPRAGGQYVFLREAYGRSIGFVFGWSTLLVIQTGTIAAVAVAFAKFLGVFLPQVAATEYLIRPIHLGDHYAISLTTQQGVAILIILGLTWMNTRGLRTGKIVMNLFTFTKTAALIALIVLGIGYGMLHAGDRAAAAWSSSWWDSSANGWNLDAATKASGVPVVGMLGFLMLFGKAMVGPLFSQTGWNGVTFTGGEVRDPGKTLPRALLISCGTVVLLYLLANAAYVMTLSLGEIQNAPNERVGTATMQKIFPGFGAQIMAVAIMVSTFGCINGLILSGARVYYAMARDGLFFRRAGMTNSRHVPAFALIAQGIWAAILVLPLTIKGLKPGTNMHDYGNLYGQLLDYIVPVDLLFYSLMVGSVIVFRLKRPDAERPYRAIGYPVTPLIYIGLAFLMVANFIYLSPKVSGIGFLIALTGLPVYFVWSRFGRKTSDDTALV